MGAGIFHEIRLLDFEPWACLLVKVSLFDSNNASYTVLRLYVRGREAMLNVSPQDSCENSTLCVGGGGGR